MGMDTRIPFAIKTDSGQVVAIDDVERGLRCECHCPSCHGRLVAKKGQIKEHHFAHHDASQQECLYAFETSVRLMLMEKLDDISVLNTPAKSVVFEGSLHEVSAPHFNIRVQRIAQDSLHGVPTAIYQLDGRSDYQIGLYLPPVHEKLIYPPEWLVAYSNSHRKTGVLGVRYGHFYLHMFNGARPKEIDTVSWMLKILSENPDCLLWLYHPGEARELMILAQSAEEQKRKLAAQMAAENARRAEEVRLHQRRVEQRRIEMHKRRAFTGHSVLIEEDDRSVEPKKVPPPVYCKHCKMMAPSTTFDGYCFRESCIRSRQHSSVPHLDKVRSHTTPYAMKKTSNIVGSALCPRCRTSMQKVGSIWWCKSCGTTQE